jgi:hypothetical protein
MDFLNEQKEIKKVIEESFRLKRANKKLSKAVDRGLAGKGSTYDVLKAVSNLKRTSYKQLVIDIVKTSKKMSKLMRSIDKKSIKKFNKTALKIKNHIEGDKDREKTFSSLIKNLILSQKSFGKNNALFYDEIEKLMKLINESKSQTGDLRKALNSVLQIGKSVITSVLASLIVAMIQESDESETNEPEHIDEARSKFTKDITNFRNKYGVNLFKFLNYLKDITNDINEVYEKEHTLKINKILDDLDDDYRNIIKSTDSIVNFVNKLGF